MKVIRKGNDINILWEIFGEIDGVKSPYDLTGKDLSLYLENKYGRKEVTDFSTEENMVVWSFRGKDQKNLGVYSLILVVNEGEEFMHTIDECDAFEIVSHTCIAEQECKENLRISTQFNIGAITPDTSLNPDSLNVVTNAAICEALEAFRNEVNTQLTQFEEATGADLSAYKAEINAIFAHYKEGVNGTLNELREKVENLSHDALRSPIIYGEADNSAILDGEYEGYSNRAISQTSMAVGAGTIAGLKGWYYSKIDFTNKKITLSDTRVINTYGVLSGGGWSSGTPNIKGGDFISLVNNTKFDFCSKVTNVSGNIITVDSLPFSSLNKDGIYASLDDNSIYIPDRPDAGLIDFGGGAFAEGGYFSKASNICSHAEGLQTHAYGQYSHAEGRETRAAYASHAEGRNSEATGETSHAEGFETLASGDYSHAEGSKLTENGVVYRTISSGKYSHAEGRASESSGEVSHAEGYRTKANGQYSHAQGQTTFTDSNARAAHAEGIGGIFNDAQTGAFGIASHSEGVRTTASAQAAHSEGQETIASGKYSHAEGNTTTASGNYSHAEGQNTIAEGDGTHAEGKGTHAIGNYSHAEGWSTIAEGTRAHAEGDQTYAYGQYSHAEGERTTSNGRGSHAEGFRTIAENDYEHACGRFNSSIKSSDMAMATAFSIGRGETVAKRKNLLEVKANGDLYISGVDRTVQSILDASVRCITIPYYSDDDFEGDGYTTYYKKLFKEVTEAPSNNVVYKMDDEGESGRILFVTSMEFLSDRIIFLGVYHDKEKLKIINYTLYDGSMSRNESNLTTTV